MYCYIQLILSTDWSMVDSSSGSTIFIWSYNLHLVLQSSSGSTIFMWFYNLQLVLQSSASFTIFTWVYHLTDWLFYLQSFNWFHQLIYAYEVELTEGENCEILFGIKVTCSYSCEVNTSLFCIVTVHLKDLCKLSLKNWYPTTVEFCTLTQNWMKKMKKAKKVTFSGTQPDDH